jgi:hypothetical protein
MPISVVLTDEFDKEVARLDDVTNMLHHLLPSVEDSSYHYLPFIDWYGDTVFNQLQMKPFLDEWTRRKKAAETAEETALMEQVAALALRCQAELHLYLKFYGD